MNTEELFKKYGVSFTEGRFLSHLNLGNAGIRLDGFKINWPGNKIDGRTIIRQVYTPKTKHKGWGKGELTFLLEGDEKQTFDTIEAFIKHYAAE